MNEFFENLGKKISETADVVGKTAEDVFDNVSKKTGELVEEQKLKSKMRALAKENVKAYQLLGKMVYEEFQAGNCENIGYADICRDIEARTEQIAEYRKQVAAVKGYDVCGQCHSNIEPTATYCPNCGAKVDDTVTDADYSEVMDEPEFEDTDL